MPSLQERFVDLRAPPELKAVRGEQYDQHIKQVILKQLHATPAQTLAYGDDPKSSPANVLDGLDPLLDTLPYLFSLYAQVQILSGKANAMPDALKPGGDMFDRLVEFLRRFDPIEVRYAGAEWRELVKLLGHIAHGMVAADMDPRPILTLLASAMLRLDPSAGTLSSTHLLYIQLCLDARAYREARLILDKDIHSIASNAHTNIIDCPYLCADHSLSNGYMTPRGGLSEKLTLEMVQEYYLSGAMAYIGLQEWTSASYFLEHVMAIPTNNSANGLMLEAYRKWTLVELMATGRCSLQPRMANGGTIKLIRSASKAYEGVVLAFKDSDPQKLHAEVFEAQAIWNEDANAGLVHQVVEHHQRLFVIQMQKVYAALPMNKVATMLGMPPAQTERYISKLIGEGSLNATIEASSAAADESKVLRFSAKGTGPLAKPESELRQELVSQTRRIQDLSSHVAEADKRLSMTREYIEHVRKTRRSQGERDGLEEDGMDIPTGPTQSSDDENVMTA